VPLSLKLGSMAWQQDRMATHLIWMAMDADVLHHQDCGCVGRASRAGCIHLEAELTCGRVVERCERRRGGTDNRCSSRNMHWKSMAAHLDQ
jgi:hypothetical protein